MSNFNFQIFKIKIYRFENFTAPTAPNSQKNTKIVKFSASDESFLVFIFNYELDIFYPIFKNDKNQKNIFVFAEIFLNFAL